MLDPVLQIIITRWFLQRYSGFQSYSLPLLCSVHNLFIGSRKYPRVRWTDWAPIICQPSGDHYYRLRLLQYLEVQTLLPSCPPLLPGLTLISCLYLLLLRSLGSLSCSITGLDSASPHTPHTDLGEPTAMTGLPSHTGLLGLTHLTLLTAPYYRLLSLLSGTTDWRLTSDGGGGSGARWYPRSPVSTDQTSLTH